MIRGKQNWKRPVTLAAWTLLILFFFNACKKEEEKLPESPVENIPAIAAGDIDLTFNPGTGANWPVNVAIIQPDGKILVGGPFSSYHGTLTSGICRINPDGSLDNSFKGDAFEVKCMALQPDGKILIGGDFAMYNGVARYRFARINPNGTLDNTFDMEGVTIRSGVPAVYCIALQPDGKIIIGGSFDEYNGETRYNIARLYPDGSLDTSFNAKTGGSVHAIAIRNDGKIYAGGAFSSFNGASIGWGVTRLNADGSLDEAFNSGSGLWASRGMTNDAVVRAFAIQPDGKVVIAGYFHAYNGIYKSGIIRINPDGALDQTFTGVGVSDMGGESVNHVSVQADGKIIISGGFSSYRGTGRGGICFINPDGTLDNAFVPKAITRATGPFASSISAHAVQADGKIIVVGEFGGYDGVSRNRIVRILGK